jgi:hypothetical protein
MLEKDPERRPSVARIRELVDEMRTSPRSQRAVAVAGMRQQETKILDEVAPPRGRRRLWIALAIGTFVVVAVALAGYRWQLNRDDASPEPPAAVIVMPPVAPPPPPPPPTPAPAPVAPSEAVATPTPVAPVAPVTRHRKKPAAKPPEPKHVDPKPEAPKPRTDDDAIRSPFDTK